MWRHGLGRMTNLASKRFGRCFSRLPTVERKLSTPWSSMRAVRTLSAVGVGGDPDRANINDWSRWLKWAALGTAGAWMSTKYSSQSQRGRVGLQSRNCGIVAYVGEKEALPFLMEGLNILQNRGYDSAGVATVGGHGKLRVTKYASRDSTSDCIKLLQAETPTVHAADHVGIAHTRWATHGGKTDENAHPHVSQDDVVAVVHNGTIENCMELKKDLQEKHDIDFQSETDTEVIAQLIALRLRQNPDWNIEQAVASALAVLEGTWGLAIVSRHEPEKIVVARHGSPLVVGLHDGGAFVASEPSAFGRHTLRFIPLDDGEVSVVTKDGPQMNMDRVQLAHKEEILLSPEPYPHWTLKEIYEQPQAIWRTLGNGGRFHPDGYRVKLGGMDSNLEQLLSIHNLVFGACGTSLHAASYGAKLMRMLGCFQTVQTCDAAELGENFFPTVKPGLCAISQSGETKDTHRVVSMAGKQGVPRFSVINRVGSLIARTTNCGVYLNAGREHGVASTKAFTTQVTALALIAAWFGQNRYYDTSGNVEWDPIEGDGTEPGYKARPPSENVIRELLRNLHLLPTHCGIVLNAYDQCKTIAHQISNQDHMFVLGKGMGEPIAKEGALKIKEISYIHAEGYGGGSLKHGPFALLEEGTPVIMLVLNDEHLEMMRIAAQEVKARGARVIIITDVPDQCQGFSDDIITIPSNGVLTALTGVIPLQIIAYELALLRGCDPDKPRNLAKAVTVD